MPPNYYYRNASKAECSDAQNNNCAICQDKKKFQAYALCEQCHLWFHPKCLGLDPKVIREAPKEQPFICRRCNIDMATPEPSSSQATSNGANRSFDGTFGPFDQPIFEHPGQDYDSSSEREQKGLVDNYDHGNETYDEVISPEPVGHEKPSSQRTELYSTDEEVLSDTDEEGYAEITKVVAHKGTGENLRFQVEFRKDKSLKWLSYKHCDGALTLVNEYARLKSIPVPLNLKHKYPSGATSTTNAIKELWVSTDKIVQVIKTYGDKSGIQPEVFTKLAQKDGLFVLQVGQHCFAVIFLANKKICILADGQNTFIDSKRTRALVLTALEGAEYVEAITYLGQLESDKCGGSCAAIAIELQRLYKTKNWPSEIQPSTSIKKRVNDSLYKEQGRKLNPPKTLQGNKFRAQCENCGTTFPTKNRGALNLHRCK